MANSEVDLPSGEKLIITTAPFRDAMTLWKKLLTCLQGMKLPENPLEMDVSEFKDAVLRAAASDEVEASLFKCLERAAYGGQKVTLALFDDPTVGDKARGDMYAIFFAAIKLNCTPFFGQAFSWLKTRPKTLPATPK